MSDKKDQELKQEIKKAVEQERAAHQEVNEDLPKNDSSEPKRGKLFFDQLRRDFDDNHLGDARRFSERFLGGLVHDNIQGCWYKYQDTHWDQDRGYTHIHKVTEISADFKGQASFYAQKVEEIKASDAYILAPTKTERNEMIKPLLSQQKAYEQRAKELKDPARIEKVLKMSRVCTPGYLGIIGTEWNKDPYLFACGNKVIDLRTGKALD